MASIQNDKMLEVRHLGESKRLSVLEKNLNIPLLSFPVKLTEDAYESEVELELTELSLHFSIYC